MSYRVLGIGTVVADLLVDVDHYPNENDEIRCTSRRTQRGGNVSNTLSVLSSLGINTFFAGTMADDYWAGYLVDDFKLKKIDVRYAIVVENSESPVSQIVVNTENGSRTIIHSRNLREMTFRDFEGIPVQGFDWIHFEGRSVDEMETGLAYLKNNYPSIPVSLEVEKPRQGIERLLEYPDVIIFSRVYATACGFSDARTFLDEMAAVTVNARYLFCAWGEDGAFLRSRDGDHVYAPAVKPEKVVDTTGAGDVFNAGVIYGILNGNSGEQILKQACAMAGRKCSSQGLEYLWRNI